MSSLLLPLVLAASCFAQQTSQQILASAKESVGTTVCTGAVSSYPLSCSSSSVSNTCCTTSPGGHLLQTQFWDTGSESTGPNNSWTVHGLWPDTCDGSYEQYCDTAREYTNITEILQSFGQTNLLAYMDEFWKDYQGDDASFWSHEWSKHGTCISSLSPTCFLNYQAQEEVVAFFNRTTSLYATLPTYDTLASAGILPSLTKTYNLAEITNALQTAHGGGVNINCKDGVFNEVWYHFVTRGGLVDGEFVPAAHVGSASTCPTSNIHYYPKFTDLPSESAHKTSSSHRPHSTRHAEL